MTSPGGAVPEWTLGDRLAKALKYADVSPEQIAAHLGLKSTNTIGNYISGRTKISHGYIVLWAQICGVDPVWLETGQPPGGTVHGSGAK